MRIGAASRTALPVCTEGIDDTGSGGGGGGCCGVVFLLRDGRRNKNHTTIDTLAHAALPPTPNVQTAKRTLLRKLKKVGPNDCCTTADAMANTKPMNKRYVSFSDRRSPSNTALVQR